VLIVAYHMVPYTNQWGASQRMYYLANQLVDNGFDVSLVHASFGLNESFEKKKAWKSILVSIKPEFIQKLQERNQAGLQGSRNKKNSKSIRSLVHDGFSYLLHKGHYLVERQLYNDFGRTGIFARIWSLNAWSSIKKESISCDTEHVILSGPYFSTFGISEKIKKNFPEVKVTLDYRDPWSHLPKGSTFCSRYKEEKYLNIADNITVFSDMFGQDLAETYDFNHQKLMTVYNGYDIESWRGVLSNSANVEKGSDQLSNEKMVVSYIASNIILNNGFRDPANFIESLSSSKYAKNIELNLVGVDDKSQFEKYRSTDLKINLLNRVPPQRTLEIMIQSDVLIILTTDLKPSLYTLTGKLFDYLRSGAYIVGVSNDEAIAYSRLIEDLEVGVSCSNDVNRLRQVVDGSYEKWLGGLLRPKLSNESIESFSRYHQNEKLISWMRSN